MEFLSLYTMMIFPVLLQAHVTCLIQYIKIHSSKSTVRSSLSITGLSRTDPGPVPLSTPCVGLVSNRTPVEKLNWTWPPLNPSADLV